MEQSTTLAKLSEDVKYFCLAYRATPDNEKIDLILGVLKKAVTELLSTGEDDDIRELIARATKLVKAPEQPESKAISVKTAFIESLRDDARELANVSNWYRKCSCPHMANITRVKHRMFLDLFDVIEKAPSKKTLLEQLFEIQYNNDTRAFYVDNGLMALAEYADARLQAIYMVRDKVLKLDEF